MKSAAQIASEPIAQSQLPRQNRSTRRQPTRLDQLPENGISSFIFRSPSTFRLEFVAPIRAVCTRKNIFIRLQAPAQKIFARGNFLVQSVSCDQSEFLRRKYVRAKIQIVAYRMEYTTLERKQYLS